MMHFVVARERLSRTLSSAVDVVRYWLFIPFLFAVAVGFGAWAGTHNDLLTNLTDNKVPKDDRYVVLAFIGASLLVIGFFYAAFIARHRCKDGVWPGFQAVLPLHRFLCFLFIFPIIGVLSIPKIESKDPIFVVFLIFAASIACFPTFFEISRFVSKFLEKRFPSSAVDDPRGRLISRLAAMLPGLVVFALFVAYCVHFSRISINNYQAFVPRTLDVSIYTNILYNSAHGDFLGCSLCRSGNHASAHFDPILILLSPLFMLYPHPEFMAILQTIWLGLGVFPVFWLAGRVLKTPWAAVGVAFVYLVHPSLQLVNLFEFHSLALIASPILLALYLLEARRLKNFFVLLPFLLFIREDVSLLMCFVGVAVILSNRKDAWVGSLTILVSITYFVVIKRFFMVSSGMIMSGKDAYNYTFYFRYMIPHGDGVGDIVVSMLTNPLYTLRYSISMAKLEFILKLLGPIGFISLFSKKWRITLCYSAVFILLSSWHPVFWTRYHYQIVAYPFLIALLPFGIDRIVSTRRFSLPRKHFLTALIGSLMVSCLMNSVMFGVIKNEKRSLYVYELSPKQVEKFEKVRELINLIPPDASVQTNQQLAPYLSSRKEVYGPPQDRTMNPPDYLLLDRKRVRSKHLKKFDHMIKTQDYKEIARYQHTVLYKRDTQKKSTKK